LVIVLLDACFLIGLRNCNKTFLLPEVANLLSWKLLIPSAAYNECVAKTVDPNLCEMISKGLIVLCQSPPEVFAKIRERHSSLGNGEIDALAYAISCKEKKDPVIMITSDQRPIKVANEMGIKTLTTLDFFKKVCELGLMTKEEMHKFIPVLQKHMWLSPKVLDDFRNEIE
jgi:predicted nucleic acid-binding protein